MCISNKSVHLYELRDKTIAHEYMYIPMMMNKITPSLDHYWLNSFDTDGLEPTKIQKKSKDFFL